MQPVCDWGTAQPWAEPLADTHASPSCRCAGTFPSSSSRGEQASTAHVLCRQERRSHRNNPVSYSSPHEAESTGTVLPEHRTQTCCRTKLPQGPQVHRAGCAQRALPQSWLWHQTRMNRSASKLSKDAGSPQLNLMGKNEMWILFTC